MTVSEEHILEICEKIEKKRPVIHCITNAVTANDCANILLAAGASPTMAHHPMEVSEITAGSSALVCNMGAITDFEAMLGAGKCAHKLGHPIVLDPVGVSGSGFRRQKCEELIREIRPTCIRGNYSEICALIRQTNTAAGVDSAGVQPEEKDLKDYAEKTGSLIIASGPVDLITDGHLFYRCTHGDPLQARITGSGCMSSAMLGAFLSAENSLESAAACCAFIGITAERAAKKAASLHGGTMTFRSCFIDEISLYGTIHLY